MSNSRDSEVIRWRRHTPRSRAFVWGSNALTLLGVAAIFTGIGGQTVGLVLILAGLAVLFLVRREMAVTLRPRPKRPTDVRDFSQLIAMQFGLTLVTWPIFIWAGVEVGNGRANLTLILAAVVAGIAGLIGNVALRRAYERLFDRIAAKDGAYGL